MGGACSETGGSADAGEQQADNDRDHVLSTQHLGAGEPVDDDVTMMTSHRDTEEEELLQPSPAGADLVTSSCEGQTHQTSDVCSSDRLENRQSVEVTESSEMSRSLNPVSTTDVKPCRGPTTVCSQDAPRPGPRMCDDCRTLGITRRKNGEKTQRWNSPASSQQPGATRIQRTARSTARPSQDQAVRARPNFSTDGKKITGGAAEPQNHCRRQRAVASKQLKCRSDGRTIANDTDESAAASGRRDVTSGHVTGRSLSARMATCSGVTSGPGHTRRCQSSDERRQRQKNVTANETSEPFRRKCCCAARTIQGQGQGHYRLNCVMSSLKLCEFDL